MSREQRLAQISQIQTEIGRVYLGGESFVEFLLVGLIAQGHILLEGVPGVAKTTLVKAFADCLGVSFQRIQFTPDLLPADITGSYIYHMKKEEFELRKGPLFANIVLADEVNRAPAKTQSAMLEAMAEQQITIEGECHELPPPFMVMATQNPVEQEGVYPLPEAQLDRFLMKLYLDYPSRNVERSILRCYRKPPEPIHPIIDQATVRAWQAEAEEIHVSEELEEYILDLVTFTRTHQAVLLGASPRGSLGLMRGARAMAFLRGRDYVLPDDLRALATPILAHRLLLQPEAELEGFASDQVCKEALKRVAVIPQRG